MSNQKVVLITGSSSGFGKLAAETLAAKGHKVYATMRNTQSKNSEVANELKAKENIEVLELDVTNETSIQSAINEIKSNEGRLDALVNNAGVGAMGLLESFSTEELKRVFDVNVFGLHNTTRHALPIMRDQKDGLIVNVSSIMGRFTVPLFGNYTATKFAVEALSEAWHYELTPFGIDTVSLQPGAFPTTSFGANMMGMAPADQSLAPEYGNAVTGYPEKIQGMFEQMAQAPEANPQRVADAISELVETPQGQRPLHKVVDPFTQEMWDEYNQSSEALQDQMMEVFGMQEFKRDVPVS